jgi:hypothetical protein
MPHLAVRSTAPRSTSDGAARWRAIFEALTFREIQIAPHGL